MSDHDDDDAMADAAACALLEHADDAEVAAVMATIEAATKDMSPATIVVALATVIAELVEQSPPGTAHIGYLGAHALIDHFLAELDDARESTN
jgi:hypothetical protein